MNSQRKKAEDLIYKVMDVTDKTGSMTAYYREKFSRMNDKEFQDWASKPLCLRFYTKPFEVEPRLQDIKDGLDILNIPFLEKVALPYLYINKDGKPVWSKKALVGYIHNKKMKQFASKKNSTPISIENRDMKSGLLMSHDKGGKSSDREMESMSVLGMSETMKEMSTYRADFMDAKSEAYQILTTTGTLSQKDLNIENRDSLAKNMVNAFLIGSLINTNMLNIDYYLPSTIEDKKRKTIRETE